MNEKKTAVVTGALKGLGFETARQLAEKGYRVVLTGRSAARGRACVKALRAQVGPDVHFMDLDVSRIASIRKFTARILKEQGQVDVLVNNAGIFPDKSERGKKGTGLTVLEKAVRTAFETNALGPCLLCQELVPSMLKNGYGRVVNVSSGMGQLSEMNGGYPGYRMSKTALNAVTRIFADLARGKDVLVNSVCPGWVKTDMGGPGAERSIEEGADTIVWLATLPSGGPSGGFFRDRKPLSW